MACQSDCWLLDRIASRRRTINHYGGACFDQFWLLESLLGLSFAEAAPAVTTAPRAKLPSRAPVMSVAQAPATSQGVSFSKNGSTFARVSLRRPTTGRFLQPVNLKDRLEISS